MPRLLALSTIGNARAVGTAEESLTQDEHAVSAAPLERSGFRQSVDMRARRTVHRNERLLWGRQDKPDVGSTDSQELAVPDSERVADPLFRK